MNRSHDTQSVAEPTLCLIGRYDRVGAFHRQDYPDRSALLGDCRRITCASLPMVAELVGGAQNCNVAAFFQQFIVTQLPTRDGACNGWHSGFKANSLVSFAGPQVGPCMN